jgi:hypothetical protein
LGAPICPLVAGLSREPGEFILGRISQIAAAARAPLAAEHCKANFYVVVTPEPDVLLKKWWHRDPNMYNTANGMGHINSFLHDPHPIRCWYNSGFLSSDGGASSPDALVAGLSGSGLENIQAPTIVARDPTRIRYTAVQSLSSVIVVVDMNRAHDLSLRITSPWSGLRKFVWTPTSERHQRYCDCFRTPKINRKV